MCKELFWSKIIFCTEKHISIEQIFKKLQPSPLKKIDLFISPYFEKFCEILLNTKDRGIHIYKL